MNYEIQSPIKKKIKNEIRREHRFRKKTKGKKNTIEMNNDL